MTSSSIRQDTNVPQQMKVFVISSLMAVPPGAHVVVATGHADSYQKAADVFKVMSGGVEVSAEWVEQATTGGTLPFVYANKPDFVVLVSVHIE